MNERVDFGIAGRVERGGEIRGADVWAEIEQGLVGRAGGLLLQRISFKLVFRKR